MQFTVFVQGPHFLAVLVKQLGRKLTVVLVLILLTSRINMLRAWLLAGIDRLGQINDDGAIIINENVEFR